MAAAGLQTNCMGGVLHNFNARNAIPPKRLFTVRANKVEPSDKSVEIMRKFSEIYARRSGTYFCVDKGVTSVVIKGLAEHKDTLGAPLCPCRHYDDKAAEAQQGFWNCPCVPMRERKECHCMLFLTPENDFAGKDQCLRLGTIVVRGCICKRKPMLCNAVCREKMAIRSKLAAVQEISPEEIKQLTSNL